MSMIKLLIKIKSKCREVVRACILDFMSLFCKPAPCVYILNGHLINRNHETDADGEHFGSLLAEIHKYCDFVNFEDALHLILERKQVSRCTIAFTFDDGWRDCYTQIVPQLEKYGINAMFFINPNFPDAADRNDTEYIENFTVNVTKSPGKSPMTWNQMKDLQRRGFLFGAHTMDHYCINDDNEAELEHQIGDCKRIMEEKFGTACEHFAFPYGRLEHANPKSIEIACKHYKYVYSQSDYKHFFSYGGKVINRRHFEPYWPARHLFYFLSHNRK